MSVQDWGAIGELVSAIAIIVTLVYLAVQVKYARIAATDASRANRVEGIHAINSLHLSDSFYRSTWNKASGPGIRKVWQDIGDHLDLSEEEASVLMFGGSNWVFLHWAQFRSIKTPEDEAELRNIVRMWYSENPMRTLIDNEGFRAFFDKDILDFIDANIEENEMPDALEIETRATNT